jgi:hypothetical protein
MARTHRLFIFIFCVVSSTILLAQKPTYTTRLFYPPDTSITSFTINVINSNPLIMSDSSMITLGTAAVPRHLSRFDKRGNLLWTKAIRNDSLNNNITTIARMPDNTVIATGTFRPAQGTNIFRIFLVKFDTNANVLWTRVYNLPQPSNLTSTSVSTQLTVNSKGSILAATVIGFNDSWTTSYLLTNASGVVQKAWTFNESMRPTSIATTRDDGFIMCLSAPSGGLINGLATNMRLVWLNAGGDVLRSTYYSPLTGTNLNFLSGKILPLPLPDSSLIITFGPTLTRVANNGAIIWSKRRIFAATTGVSFNSATSLVTNALLISKNNKIYLPSGLFETTLGLGKELPVISEHDFDGNMRSWAYTNQNSRISSISELANNVGFIMTADTIIPSGTSGITKSIASRFMIADPNFNAGCGAPVLLNTSTIDGNIQVSTSPITLGTIPFVTGDFSSNSITTAAAVTVLTKGECPASIVRTNELHPSLVKVFPNPSQGDFTVQSEDAPINRIGIFDIAGRLVTTLQNKNETTSFSIDKPGTYFLIIETTKGQLVKKVVKMN